jgi:parallel beta-helix repeat protein
VTAREDEAFGSIRGILVDDAAFGTVTVIGNALHDNVAPDGETSSGISFENSDGSLIQQNRVSDNGTYGIHLNTSSDQNRVFDNGISGSGELDAFDEGTGNCWNGTTAGTSDPSVLRVC